MNNFVQSEKETLERETTKLEASKLLTAAEAKELQSSFDEDVYREYVSHINKRISDEAKRNVGFVVITESPFCYWASYVEDKEWHLLSETEKRIFRELQENGLLIVNYFHEDESGYPTIGLQLFW